MTLKRYDPIIEYDTPSPYATMAQDSYGNYIDRDALIKLLQDRAFYSTNKDAEEAYQSILDELKDK